MSTVRSLTNDHLVVTAPGRPTQVVTEMTSSTRTRTLTETFEVVETTPGKGLRALGWRFYQDPSAADAEPLKIEAGQRVRVPVFDGGPLSQQYGVKSDGWLRPGIWRFYPDNIGDVFHFRLNLTVRPTVNNKSFLVDFDIGTLNRVWNDRVYLTSGAGIPVPKSFEATIGCSTGIVQNGGAFFITPETDLYVTRVSVLAVKQYSVAG